MRRQTAAVLLLALGLWTQAAGAGDGVSRTVYANTAANAQPRHASLWADRNYRRLKQAHNYYSP